MIHSVCPRRQTDCYSALVRNRYLRSKRGCIKGEDCELCHLLHAEAGHHAPLWYGRIFVIVAHCGAWHGRRCDHMYSLVVSCVPRGGGGGWRVLPSAPCCTVHHIPVPWSVQMSFLFVSRDRTRSCGTVTRHPSTIPPVRRCKRCLRAAPRAAPHHPPTSIKCPVAFFSTSPGAPTSCPASLQGRPPCASPSPTRRRPLNPGERCPKFVGPCFLAALWAARSRTFSSAPPSGAPESCERGTRHSRKVLGRPSALSVARLKWREASLRRIRQHMDPRRPRLGASRLRSVGVCVLKRKGRGAQLRPCSAQAGMCLASGVAMSLAASASGASGYRKSAAPGAAAHHPTATGFFARGSLAPPGEEVGEVAGYAVGRLLRGD